MVGSPAGGTAPAVAPTPGPSSAPVDLRGVALLPPVNGTITQRFSRSHTGVDLAAPHGTPILAASDGFVSAAGRDRVGGLFTCLRLAGGVESCYYHASAIHVRIGQQVRRGDVVAAVGRTGQATGPHVHWEVRRDGRLVDPLGR